jgi:hypothetical protein
LCKGNSKDANKHCRHGLKKCEFDRGCNQAKFQGAG